MTKNPYLKIIAIIFSPAWPFNLFDVSVTRRQVIELLISVFIISILATIANIEYSDHVLRAKITHFTGQINDRTEMFVYHAFNGKWPDTKETLNHFKSEIGLEIKESRQSDYYQSQYIEKVIIENGVFHILFKEALEGKTLSIRPAVPEKNKTGPIILVCAKNKPGWSIAGMDKTTVDQKLISRYLR